MSIRPVPCRYHRAQEARMRRFLCIGGLSAALLTFSPSLLADGVHSFARLTERADSDFDNPNFADGNSALVGRHFAFFESRTLGSNEDHLNWLDDSEDHHGNALGWRKDHHHHHHDGDSGWSFGDQDNGDQDNQDTDKDSGNAESTGSGDSSTSAVPEPSVLVLLSTALAAFLLKSLRRATV